jgi:hypothetical protein
MKAGRSRLVIISASIVLLLSLLAAWSAWWQSDGRACPIPKDTDPSAGIVDPHECRVLRHLTGIASREGSELIVSLSNGTKVSFNDNQEESDSWEAYRLVGYAPKSNVVEIVIGYYEASAGLLIDRATGQELDISYIPHRSPDERSWAIVKTDYLNGDMNVQVAGLTGAGLVLLADHVETAGENCDFLGWDSTQAFRIVCSDLNGAIQEQVVSVGGAGKWTASSTGKIWSAAAFEKLQSGEE